MCVRFTWIYYHNQFPYFSVLTMIQNLAYLGVVSFVMYNLEEIVYMQVILIAI
jgi:hypothetical protein